MKTWHKVAIGLGGAVLVGGIVSFSINQANKGVVTVQTAKVAKLDSLVSQVTASGEVKPTTYTNITAQGFGRITEIVVREGDHIKKGDKLLAAGQRAGQRRRAGARRRHQFEPIGGPGRGSKLQGDRIGFDDARGQSGKSEAGLRSREGIV